MNLSKFLKPNQVETVTQSLTVDCNGFWEFPSSNAYYLTGMFGMPFCDALTFNQDLKKDAPMSTLFYEVTIFGTQFVFQFILFATFYGFLLAKPITDLEYLLKLCLPVTILVVTPILNVYRVSIGVVNPSWRGSLKNSNIPFVFSRLLLELCTFASVWTFIWHPRMKLPMQCQNWPVSLKRLSKKARNKTIKSI